LSSTNRPSSTSTSLTFALAILLFRCQGKGCNRDRSRKHVTWDAIGIDESLAEETPLTDSDTHVISALPSRQYFRHRQIERLPIAVRMSHRVHGDDFIERQRLARAYQL